MIQYIKYFNDQLSLRLTGFIFEWNLLQIFDKILSNCCFIYIYTKAKESMSIQKSQSY